jgi:bifunctional enzyme CysN/CysC
MSAALAQADAFPVAANDTAVAPRALLRFIACGSVDDGKSTLIGRLLFEAGAVPDDIAAALRADSAAIGNASGGLDYSLLVDGLQAEREQGITIDVAYRYFGTSRRSFIVADTPGHEQYTRNMATGASSADLAIILIDARKGVLPQTRRHSLIVSLVGVRHVVVAINKIDLIGFDTTTVRAIEAEYRAAVAGLGFETITVIPVSAREGDNIVQRSTRTPWYDGPTLLGWLEDLPTERAAANRGFLMPVQWVNRPNLDFRGYAGTVAAGSLKPGDTVVAMRSGVRAKVAQIVTFNGDLEEARVGQAVTLTLDRDIDIARGDVLMSASAANQDGVATRSDINVQLFVTADRSIRSGDSFIVQTGSGMASGRVVEVLHATNIESFERHATDRLALNDLGSVRLRLDTPLVVAPYDVSQELGALILIDRLTNATAAMGTIFADRGQLDDNRVVAFRRKASQTLEQTLGPEWRQDIAPATSWRLGSALLLGAVVAVVTHSLSWGVMAALIDAAFRPLLRHTHRRAWAIFRKHERRQRDLVSNGGGI